MKRLLYGTTTAQGNDTTSATNALIVRNSTGNVLLGITNDGAVRIGTNASATTQTTASITASGSGTNIGLALVPKGTGAITLNIPDGTASGGNARGIYAIDLQRDCSGASRVASGARSFAAGRDCTASGSGTVAIGDFNQATGNSSASVGGYGNLASASWSSVFGGQWGYAYLYGMNARASDSFATNGYGQAQTCDLRYRRSIQGTAITELFLDGTSVRAVVAGNRVWNSTIQVVAVCTVQGAGTVTVGEVFGGNYAAIIKRIGNTTSLVGTVQNLHTAQTDTNMATAAVTITADDTNESLKIEFTPPTTAAADTVIRVVATVYLTEVGY